MSDKLKSRSKNRRIHDQISHIISRDFWVKERHNPRSDESYPSSLGVYISKLRRIIAWLLRVISGLPLVISDVLPDIN